MSESDINLDIIRKIASFVDATVGPELMNLLIAVGPADARKIRRDYLRHNDAYLVQSLRLCLGATAPALHMFTANSSTIMNMYLLSIKYFNKCRDNVLAWMDVNPGWKSRCTTANLKRYHQRILPEANVIFNNPVVAIELDCKMSIRIWSMRSTSMSVTPATEGSPTSLRHLMDAWTTTSSIKSLLPCTGEIPKSFKRCFRLTPFERREQLHRRTQEY